MVLKALAQYIVLVLSRSAKVIDPLLLTDGTNPILIIRSFNYKISLKLI